MSINVFSLVCLWGRFSISEIKKQMANIEYTKNFRIPQLSLEPIVENAVKHGIGEGGGIANTRKRLELLCGGRLSINITPEGTTADIIIPVTDGEQIPLNKTKHQKSV